jgi:hypothetical protein
VFDSKASCIVLLYYLVITTSFPSSSISPSYKLIILIGAFLFIGTGSSTA